MAYIHTLGYIFFNTIRKFMLNNILKGIWNENFGLKKTLLFERTFEVIKIGLYSCRVKSLEIIK